MTLIDRYRRVRAVSSELVAPLSSEDTTVQSMDDVSPTKWHLAHTSWFFETFVLRDPLGEPAVGAPGYDLIFNSYYNGVGPQHDRPSRGLLSRPTLEEVLDYRARVDERMERALAEHADDPAVTARVEIGLNHEQQHQELILTDVLHVLSTNPLEPRYRELALPARADAEPQRWHAFDGGAVEIGAAEGGFAYDNERPRHRVWLEPFQLAERLVTSGEVRAFVEDGGYETASLWHDEGWALVREERREAPLYWRKKDGAWFQHSLAGTLPLRDEDPAVHLSWFEASAVAHWLGARLPTESEWEHAAAGRPVEGNFVDADRLRPAPPEAGADGPRQLFGDAWEWTSSAYAAYPGYRPPKGPIGEYNGKFMVNQYVLRGGSCVTARDHVRASYRNFFPARARWQFSGLRLARDAS